MLNHSEKAIDNDAIAKREIRLFEGIPGNNVLVLNNPPHFTILGVTDSYLKETGKQRQQLIGKGMFEAFPANPDDETDTGETDLRRSFYEVISHKKAHHLPTQRYDVANTDGSFEERYWNASNTPILGDDGEVEFIIHFAVEITYQVKAQQREERIRLLEQAHNLFMQAPLAIAILTGEDLVIELANEPIMAVWGKGRGIVGKRILDILPEIEHQGFIDLMKSVVTTGKPFHGYEMPVTLLRNEKAETVYFNFVYQPYYIKEADAPIGIIVFANEVTDKISSKIALKESIERFGAAIEVTEGVLWTNNDEGHMEGEQKGWAALTGQTQEEYQGYGWAKAVHPDDAPATIAAWNGAVREGKTFEFEHRLRTKSGEWRLFAIRAIPLKNSDGSIREWVGVHSDITERKKVELKIRESEERFRELADNSPMFVFIIEPDPLASVSYWNRTWLEYTGQTFQEAQGRAWDGIIHPDDLSVVMEHYAPAFENRTAYLIPAVRVKRHDGEYRWHTFKGNPRYSPGGGFNGYVGVGFDIHEQKLAEELIRVSEASLQVKVAERTAELEDQKNLLNNILVNSSNGISVSRMIRNESGRVVDAATIMANDAAVRYIGLPREIYLGRTAVEVEPSVMESAYGQTCLNTLQTGEPALVQYFLEATRRWLELTISKMDDDHLIHIFTDVTPIKEAQLQLERTVEELRRSNQNLEEFAHAASHDLKEPVRKIHFYITQLKDQLSTQLQEGQVRAFGRIENATERMGNLIDDLLLYSHVTQRPHETESVDLNQKVQRVLEDLELDIEEKKAVINVEKLPVVKGYRRQLQQMFQNLISNAIKYSKADVSPRVDIAARQVTENGKACHLIEVKDNGIGFSPEYADKIFQMFTRLHNKSEYSGTGVGLSIVKKVVENHNGFIAVESSVGEGSVFKIYLPV